MTSPSPRPIVNRRRQRSTRVTVAVAAIVLAGVLVLGAVASGSSVLVVAAAIASVVLGGAAVRITYSELLQTRRDAAEDRARQAQAYRDITARRTAENMTFTEKLRAQIVDRQEVIGHLEVELSKALERAATATLKMSGEARRADLAEQDNVRLVASVDDADTRAAEAIVRVAELEAELDAMRSELEAWQAMVNEDQRKRA